MFVLFQEQISDRLFMDSPLGVISVSLRCGLKHLQLVIDRFPVWAEVGLGGGELRAEMGVGVLGMKYCADVQR